jgi:hypothetical protein
VAVEKVSIIIRAQDQFSKTLQGTGKSIKGFSAQAKSAAASARSWAKDNKAGILAVGAAVAGAGAAIGAAFLSAAAKADKFRKASEKIGMSVEDFSRLAYAADLSGVGMDGLATGMKLLSKNMADAAQGTGAAAAAFDALGLSATKSDGSLKSQNDLMLEVAAKFKGMEDGAAKTSLAMDLFGKSGADMIVLLNQGSEAIKNQTAEADRLGITLTDSGARAAEAMNDSIAKMKKSFEGVFMGTLGTLAPAITESMTSIAESFGEGGSSGAIKDWAAGFGRAVKFVVGAVRILWNWIQIAGESIGTIVGALASQIINYFETIINAARALGQVIKGVFTLDFEAVKTGINDFKGAISGGVQQAGAIAKVAFEQIKSDAKTNFEDMAKASDLMFSQTAVSEQKQTAAVEQGTKERITLRNAEAEKAAADAQKKRDEEAAKDREAAAKRAEEMRAAIVSAQQGLLESQRNLRDQELADEETGYARKLELLSANYLAEKEILALQREEELLALAENEEAKALVRETYENRFRDLKEETFRREQAIEKSRTKMILEGTKSFLGNLAKATEGSKKFGAMHKAFAIAQATIAGIEAAVYSFKEGAKIGGPVVGALFAGASAAATGKMISDIASQSFATGGFPRGRNAVARLNDDPQGGQEAVLNARATRALGFGAINQLNAGGRLTQQQQSVAINLGGIVVNGGGDPAAIEQAVQRGAERAAQQAARTLRYVRENNVPEGGR